MKNTRNSCRLYARAVKSVPGGVNSPVRACRSVGADPLFIKSADGAVIVDADGNRYIDYIGSWGPMILGHRHPAVVKALQKAIDRGTSFGAPTDLEITLAEMVIAAVPAVEMVRMVNSGTEATMSAIRLARGYTGRDLVIKFDGCYHGHADTLLVAAGSGVATLGIPGSPGVPKPTAKQTLSLPYNDSECFRRVMAKQGDRVACVIVEPVAGNMGLVAPVKGFLQTLRQLTAKRGAVLIFDEVMTGFRVAYGGAQSLYGIQPDLSCFGKIIGGGLPVGAYGGRRKIMSHIAPQGPVYQAGTLSGNPLAMAAGIATLTQLKKKGFYEQLEKKSARLCAGLADGASRAGFPVQVDHVGSMIGMFFCAEPVRSFADAKKSDLATFARFYQGMRQEGVYIAPSQFEALFLSSAHTSEHIHFTVQAAERVLEGLRK
ncbi:MAG: glutamate-1-semialdehyde 2,1-aminomutase [Desulfobacterales bacterium]|nr:glutamate-1-semialdehyde 2,1-aminomutase [Desulfobacterales bacterium]